MVEFVGLIEVNVIRGTNLAIRDMLSSDPYVILTLGQQVSVKLSSLSMSLSFTFILIIKIDQFFLMFSTNLTCDDLCSL